MSWVFTDYLHGIRSPVNTPYIPLFDDYQMPFLYCAPPLHFFDDLAIHLNVIGGRDIEIDRIDAPIQGQLAPCLLTPCHGVDRNTRTYPRHPLWCGTRFCQCCN